MAEEDDAPEMVTGEKPGRQPYEPPALVEYGTLEDLTQGVGGPPGDDAFTGTVTA